MKFIDIQTSKGNFKVFDLIDRFPLINKHFIESGAIKISEITSKEAYEVTGKKANAKDDLFRLLESQGIEITNNTYIFKV